MPTSSAAATTWVVPFAEGSREMRDLLGGKGANVAEMTRILGSDRVPAGFTITTEACVAYMAADRTLPDGLAEQVRQALEDLERQAGRRLGDPDDPLLVSVRSGARESMPGMMDTVLNLGLNDRSVEGLAATTGNERFAWDSYRRFVQMYGNVVVGLPGEEFEDRIKAAKQKRGVQLDTELDAEALRELTRAFQELYDFPQDPQAQLDGAVRAVFDSWLGDRAIPYRRINRIPDDWGTAVNVQQMVFGNKGKTSGSGVVFSRDEVTGAPEPSGDFLIDAQGEDVVSGVRNTQDIAELADRACPRRTRSSWRSCGRSRRTTEHAGRGVHRGGGAPLHAPDARRQAPSPGGGALRGRRRGRGAADQARRPWRRSTRRRSTRCCTRRSTDGEQFEVVATGVAASPGAAKGDDRVHRQRRRRGRPSAARPSCSSARSPRPTTWPASTPRRGSSPPRAARPPTRRSSRAAWAGRR